MLNVRELIWQTDEQLARYPIEEVNLAAAAGLPGAEYIDHQACFKRIKDAVRKVQRYTLERLPEFRRKPEFYHHSEAKFRVVCLIRLLTGVFNVHYNVDKIPIDIRFDAADTFIHGALMGNGGTCASLLVLYVAVGRRLGYPLKLVSCHHHLFCRRDDPRGERFNIEANNRSIDTPDDDHYRQGPFFVAPEVEKDCCYLKSHTPRMELADFVAQRGHRWLEAGLEWKQAAESFLWASALVPEHKGYAYCAKTALETWRLQLELMRPPNWPEFNVYFPQRLRRFPPTIPLNVEHHFLFFEEKEKCLLNPRHQKWWESLRCSNGVRTSDIPKSITVRIKAGR